MLEGNEHEIRRRVYDPEGVAPTLCGVGCGGNTEPKIIVGAAMRGRYNSDGKTEQQIEVRDDGLSDAITTVQKNSLVVEKQSWVGKKYAEFYEKHGYIPEYFDVYNGLELKNIAPTLSTRSNGSMGSGTVLIAEVNEEKR